MWGRRFFSTLHKTTGGSGFANLEGIERFPTFRVPCLRATREALEGHGYQVVEREADIPKMMKNSTWPKVDGWRKISAGTGNEQLPTIGSFKHYWRGNVVHADNEAVQRKYKIGVLKPATSSSSYRAVLARELNYHPCGTQIIFPRVRGPFVALLGRVPGESKRHPDDVQLSDIRAFFFDGEAGYGLCMPAYTWHQPVYAVDPHKQLEFVDWQSSVHACVVMDTLDEHSLALEIPLQPDE